MAVQIQLRRGTSAEWSSVNPVIAQGEFVIELDTGRFKLGNGVDRWNNLNYNGFIGHGSDPSNWNTNVKLGLYDVNRLSWSGTLGSPTDAVPKGLLAVYVSGTSIVQRYQPTNDALVTVEYVRTKFGIEDWSPWSQATDGAKVDGGTF